MAKMVKTVQEVLNAVAGIRASAHDYELAHIQEDDLYEGVLRTIAQGETRDSTSLRASDDRLREFVEMAKAALRSKRIKFKRVCS